MPADGAAVQDPVVASDGYTYERKAKKWLADGNGVSPKSNRPMESRTLYDSVVVKDLLRARWQRQLTAAPSRSAAAPAAPRARPSRGRRQPRGGRPRLHLHDPATVREGPPPGRCAGHRPGQPSDSTGDIDEGAFANAAGGSRPAARGKRKKGRARP